MNSQDLRAEMPRSVVPDDNESTETTYKELRAFRHAWQYGQMPDLQPLEYHAYVTAAIAAIGGQELDDLLLVYDRPEANWSEGLKLVVEAWQIDPVELITRLSQAREARRLTAVRAVALKKQLASPDAAYIPLKYKIRMDLTVAQRDLADLEDAISDLHAWNKALTKMDITDPSVLLALGADPDGNPRMGLTLLCFAFRDVDGKLIVPDALHQARLHDLHEHESEAIRYHTVGTSPFGFNTLDDLFPHGLEYYFREGRKYERNPNYGLDD